MTAVRRVQTNGRKAEIRWMAYIPKGTNRMGSNERKRIYVVFTVTNDDDDDNERTGEATATGFESNFRNHYRIYSHSHNGTFDCRLSSENRWNLK